MSVAVTNEQRTSRLAPVLSRQLFPGKANIYPFEFAKTQRMTVQQVIDLISEEVIFATRINSPNNKSERSNYRIPCSEYDRFVLQGGTIHVGQNGNGHNGKVAR